MLRREQMISIFKLLFIEGLSYRQIASNQKVHRDTVTKHAIAMKENIQSLKSELIKEGKCKEDFADEFIKENWMDYIDEILYYNYERQKRKLTSEIIKEVLAFKKKLNTSSAKVIFDYIKNEHLFSTKLSYSTIWTILKNNKT